jgi:hypothetical protein
MSAELGKMKKWRGEQKFTVPSPESTVGQQRKRWIRGDAELDVVSSINLGSIGPIWATLFYFL